MGLFDNGLKGNLISGLAVGIGVAVVAPVVIPIIASVIKPLTKGVIKQGMLLYETGLEKAAEAKEAMEDLLAETRAEMEEHSAPPEEQSTSIAQNVAKEKGPAA